MVRRRAPTSYVRQSRSSNRERVRRMVQIRRQYGETFLSESDRSKVRYSHVSVRPSDLFVSPDLTEEQAQAYLHSLGFRDAAAADRHLQEMADDLPVREALGRVAQPLLEALCAAPDPDAALVGLSRYVGARASKAMFVRYLLDDPAALGVLVELLGTSPFLTEILIRDPEYFHWLMSQLHRPPNAALEDEWGDATRPKRVRGRSMESAEALDALKRRKRQHLLLIAARDILGR